MGNPENDRLEARRFKKKLLRWGMPEEDVLACVAQFKERKWEKRAGYLAKDAPCCTMAVYVRFLRRNVPPGDIPPVLRLGDDYIPPDDKDYRPVLADSVLRGTARATGETANAVKRRKTITKFQYDERTKDVPTKETPPM